ncbi:MAG: mRNA surveillance protein pelota [Methanomassiliicoccales archaeon]
MKVLHQDRLRGEIKVHIDVPDDLWHLYNLILPGDLIIASTYRREEAKADKIRNERGEKKRVTLGIRVEKLEFHEFENRLRILGIIEEGPQDVGAHHTINMEVGEQLSIIKTHWRPSDLERARHAVEDSLRPSVVLVAIEQDEATVAVLRQYGIKLVACIAGPTGGKMYEHKEDGDFYGDVIDKVKQIGEVGVPVVILGPGFAKEHLLEQGRLREPELFKKAFSYHTGQAGMTGIHELMKRGLGGEVLKDSRVAEEVNLVEKVLEEISKDGPVTYGPAHVSKPPQSGAVEMLLVSERLVREKDIEDIMKDVDSGRGRITVVSEHHEGGRMLLSLGGMAALLRYKMPE